MARRSNGMTESDLIREIGDYMAERKIFFWRVNNGSVFGRSNDGKMRFRALPKYCRRGVPDIIAIINGDFVGLEVKRPLGKRGGKAGKEQSPHQVEFALLTTENGGFYYTVRSVEDAVNALVMHGIPRV